MIMRSIQIVLIFVMLLLVGCSSTMPYRNVGTWNAEVTSLGPVEFCVGGGCTGTDEGSQWPIALTSPPDQNNVHAALLRKASKTFDLPESEIVLKDVNVKMLTEVVGTVRGWHATAIAGRLIKKS